MVDGCGGRSEGGIVTESVRWSMSRGADLAVRLTRPRRPVRALVQIVHGMVEHAARYDVVARELAGAGYAVVAYDQRGHGRTAGHPAQVGHIDAWSDLVGDALAVGERAREWASQWAEPDAPELPLVLFGHSMGSVVARTVVLDHSEAIDALVLSGTVADPGATGRLGAVLARAEGRLRGRRAPSPLLDRLTFSRHNAAFAPARTRFDWLSRDEAAVDAYVADPWCGTVCTNGFYTELLGAMPAVHDPGRLARVRPDLPVYLFAGAEDPVGAGDALAACASAYRRAGLRDVTTRAYVGGRHEMLNDTHRQEVVDDLLHWLDQRCPPQRVGRCPTA